MLWYLYKQMLLCKSGLCSLCNLPGNLPFLARKLLIRIQANEIIKECISCRHGS